jgi:hypothetical protein
VTGCTWKYIRESIERIEEYTDGGSEDRFMRHPLVQDAVLRRLETLADASHKLPRDAEGATSRDAGGPSTPFATSLLTPTLRSTWNGCGRSSASTFPSSGRPW